MRAIEATGTVDEQGQLCLDHPLNVAEPQRVRVIVLLTESESLKDEDDEPKENVLEGFRQAWKEAQAGQTIPLEQLWMALMSNNLPPIEVQAVPEFQRRLGNLAKRYRHIRDDIQSIFEHLRVIASA